MPRLLYFASRNPKLMEAEFPKRWRQHGALGMSMARWRNVSLYVQCDRMDGPDMGVPELSCDGVAIVRFRSEEARLSHIGDREASAIMKADERETFAQPVREVSVLSDIQEGLDDEIGPLKFFMCVRRSSGGSVDRFHADWTTRITRPMTAALQAHSIAFSHNQNVARPDFPDAATGPYCDLVEEFDCTDPAAFANSVRSILSGCPVELASFTAVWTAPRVLHRA